MVGLTIDGLGHRETAALWSAVVVTSGRGLPFDAVSERWRRIWNNNKLELLAIALLRRKTVKTSLSPFSIPRKHPRWLFVPWYFGVNTLWLVSSFCRMKLHMMKFKSAKLTHRLQGIHWTVFGEVSPIVANKRKLCLSNAIDRVICVGGWCYFLAQYPIIVSVGMKIQNKMTDRRRVFDPIQISTLTPKGRQLQ